MRPASARRRASEHGAGSSGTASHLVQQRQGDGRLLARVLAPVVHHRRRHRQRGLLPARRPAADPRPRVHRWRRLGVLGRGEKAVAARARARRARRTRGAHRAPPPALRSHAARHALRAPRCAAHRGGARRRFGVAPARAPRAAPRRHRSEQPRGRRAASRSEAPVGGAGSLRPRARGGRPPAARRVGPGERGLRGRERRLAGLSP